MKKMFLFIVLALIVIFWFAGCGETSIYGRWSYEDKGVLYEIRFYNEYREDKYTEFRDGKRYSGGTFVTIKDLLYLTSTFGIIDVYKYKLTYNTLSLTHTELLSKGTQKYKKKKVE